MFYNLLDHANRRGRVALMNNTQQTAPQDCITCSRPGTIGEQCARCLADEARAEQAEADEEASSLTPLLAWHECSNAATAPRPLLMPEQVTRVYSGRANACCCGCSGRYYEASEPASAAMIRKVVKILNDADELLDDYADLQAVEVGARVYIAYLD